MMMGLFFSLSRHCGLLCLHTGTEQSACENSIGAPLVQRSLTSKEADSRSIQSRSFPPQASNKRRLCLGVRSSGINLGGRVQRSITQHLYAVDASLARLSVPCYVVTDFIRVYGVLLLNPT